MSSHSWGIVLLHIFSTTCVCKQLTGNEIGSKSILLQKNLTAHKVTYEYEQ